MTIEHCSGRAIAVLAIVAMIMAAPAFGEKLTLGTFVKGKGTTGVEDTYTKDEAGPLGNEETLIVGQWGSKALIRFDLSRLKSIEGNAAITSARLHLYCHWMPDETRRVSAHAVLVPWVENEATMDEYAEGKAWQERNISGPEDRRPAPEDTCTVSGDPEKKTPHVWDLTSLVNEWVAGTLPNNGLVLEWKGKSGYPIVYRSSQHKEYNTMRLEVVLSRGEQLGEFAVEHAELAVQVLFTRDAVLGCERILACYQAAPTRTLQEQTARMRKDSEALVEGLDGLTERYANVFPMVWGPPYRAPKKTFEEWKAEYKGDPDIEIEIGDMRTRARTLMSDARDLEKRARKQIEEMGPAGGPDWGPETDRVFREDRTPDPKPIRGDGTVDRLLYGAPSHDLPRFVGDRFKAPVMPVYYRLNLDFIAQGNSWGRLPSHVYPYPSTFHWNYNRGGNMHGPPAGSAWWQEHGDDPDIWGSPHSDRKLSWIRANLNQDHPAVRKMILGLLTKMADENRTRAIGPSQYLGVWEHQYAEGKGSYGYSPQSIAKFRQWLKARTP